MMALSQGRDQAADTYAKVVAPGRAHSRFASFLLTLCTGLLIAAAPATAQAAGSEGPLLSGYGGPGAGEQVILGSQTLHSQPHHSGGGGETGSPEAASGSVAGASESRSPEASPQGSASPSTQPSTPAATHETGGETGGPASSGPAHTGHGGSSGTPASGSPARGGTQTAVVAAQPLGLSGSDLAAVIVVACALVGLGVLTRFAARGER
jgi:hypothetical protein